MQNKTRKSHRTLAAIALTLALAGVGATIAPTQDRDSAIAWDAAPQLAAAILPATAVDADALDQRSQSRLASCAESGRRGLWERIKEVVKRIIKRIRCRFIRGGIGCQITLP